MTDAAFVFLVFFGQILLAVLTYPLTLPNGSTYRILRLKSEGALILLPILLVIPFLVPLSNIAFAFIMVGIFLLPILSFPH